MAAGITVGDMAMMAPSYVAWGMLALYIVLGIVLEKLVAQYEKLFGAASREVCRDAVRPLLSQVPQDEIPAVLK